MRSSRVLTVVAAAALLAACGDSNGPSNPAPTAAFDAPSCTLLACNFVGSGTDTQGGTIASYAWDFGDPTSPSNTATTASASHTFTEAGTYTVKLTVTDNGGETGSVSHDVTVSDVPNTAPVAGFITSCSDLACTFTDQSSDADGTVASYAWDFGDAASGAQNTSTTKNPSHTFSAAGDFNVQLTVTDNSGGTNSKTNVVTVTAPAVGGPTASFEVSCTSLDCTIDNNSTATGSVVTWAWDFGDGQTSTLQDPGTIHYDVSTLTTFTIKLVVTSDGATSQATKQVTAVPAATLTCNGVDCTLPIPAGATVVVTLVSSDCQAHGNTFVITAPVIDTLFTDGCFATPGTAFPLNNGDAYTQDTELAAEVLSGLPGATDPQLQVTGDFANGWTLSFDDGFVGAGEPDFNDLVILVKATGP